MEHLGYADTGAIASHLTVGHGLGEPAILVPLVPLAALTVMSRALWPRSRRVPGR